MKALITIFTVVLVFMINSCTTNKIIDPAKSPEEKLLNEIYYLINDPALSNAQIGLYIESLNDHKIIFRNNERKLFIPASNQKIYTSSSALELLGPDFEFETEFYTNGSVEDSVLNGDLIVRGKGDPTISGRFRDDDALAYYRDWVDSLKANGINTINGNLLADENYFSDSKLGFGWNWDDEPYWYSAQISALSFNDNCIDLKISPADSIGEYINVEPNPGSEYVQILNTATTAPQDSESTYHMWRKRGQNIIEISGGLPVDRKEFVQYVTVEDPALWFMDTFKNVLQSHGIKVTGNITKTSSDYLKKDDVNLLFINKSVPLSEVVKVINKGSHNLYAEQVFKTLGAEINKRGTAHASVKVINSWLNSIGVPDNLALIVDGSGLSRMNLISPFATATILKEMYHSENFNPFFESLPIAGVDGTLKSRMKNSIAEGVVRAKTGYVKYTRSLAGYTKDRSGNDYVFVIMVNSYSVPTSYVNNMQDRICILLTGYEPDK